MRGLELQKSWPKGLAWGSSTSRIRSKPGGSKLTPASPVRKKTWGGAAVRELPKPLPHHLRDCPVLPSPLSPCKGAFVLSLLLHFY